MNTQSKLLAILNGQDSSTVPKLSDRILWS